MNYSNTRELVGQEIFNKKYYILFDKNNEPSMVSRYKVDLEKALQGWTNNVDWKVKGPFELRLM